jgi:hypothetical protein
MCMYVCVMMHTTMFINTDGCIYLQYIYSFKRKKYVCMHKDGCVCIYEFMYVFNCVCVCVGVCVSIYVLMYVNVFVHVCISLGIYMHECKFVYILSADNLIHLHYVFKYTNINVHTQTSHENTFPGYFFSHTVLPEVSYSGNS